MSSTRVVVLSESGHTSYLTPIHLLNHFETDIESYLILDEPALTPVLSNFKIFSNFDECIRAVFEPLFYAKKVSFLIPSRHNIQGLKSTLLDLISKSQCPQQIELVLGVDLDDEETIRELERLPTGFSQTILIRPRGQGYKDLNILANQLAQLASGKLLFFFSDDSRIGPLYWDNFLNPFLSYLCVLKPLTPDLVNVFPVVSKQFVNILGHLSHHTCSDAWVEDVAVSIGIQKKLPLIKPVHEGLVGLDTQNAKYALTFHEPEYLIKRLNDGLNLIEFIRQALNKLIRLKVMTEEESQVYQHYCSVLRQYEGIKEYWGTEKFNYSKNLVRQGLMGITRAYGTEIDFQNTQSAYQQLDPERLPIHEMARLAMNLNRELKAENIEDIRSTQQIFNRLLSQNPAHLIALYYLAIIHFVLNEDDIANQYCLTFHELMVTNNADLPPGLIQQISPFGSHDFIHQWETILLSEVNSFDVREKHLVQLLHWQILLFSGQYGLKSGSLSLAETHLKMALDVNSHSLLTQLTLLKLYIKQSNRSEYHLLFKKLPVFIATLAPEILEELLKQNWLDEAKEFIKYDSQLKELISLRDGLEHYDIKQLGSSLPNTITLESYNFLKQLISREHPLYPLVDSVKIGWNTHFVEPVGDINLSALDCQMICQEGLPISIGFQAQSPLSFQRVYDRPGDFSQGLIGPDMWPFQFYRSESESTSEPFIMKGLCQVNYLVINTLASSKEMIKFLSCFIADKSCSTDLTCFVWNPLGCFEEQDINQLALQLPSDVDANIVILDQEFSVVEQFELMMAMDLIIGNPIQQINYYLWWALKLGKPTWFMNKPYHPFFNEIETEVEHLVHENIQIGWQFFRERDEFVKELSQFIQIKLYEFQSRFEPQIILDTLWHLKKLNALS